MANNHNHHEEQHHIIPFSILRNVCVALLVLTALTVFCARLHLGVLAAPIAFLIALTKAMLVMAYFMGLKYDAKSNRIIFSRGTIIQYMNMLNSIPTLKRRWLILSTE